MLTSIITLQIVQYLMKGKETLTRQELWQQQTSKYNTDT